MRQFDLDEFDTDYPLEEVSIEDLLSEKELKIRKEEEVEGFFDFYLPPGKPLKFD